MKRIDTAMIFAAGLGTRLKPITNDKPKALVEVNGKTLLERNIKYLASFGINNFIINVHHFADTVIDFLYKNNNFGYTISISDERDELLETGGGLKKAVPLLKSNPFVLMNVDILTNLDLGPMIANHFKENSLATLAVINRESSRKLLFNKEGLLCGWKNINTGETIVVNEMEYNEFAFSGVHIISPQILDLFPSINKYSIIKPYLEICKKNKIQGFNHTGDILIDVGKHETLALASKKFK